MKNTTNERVPLLDFYRFLAAMLVVFFHYFANITLVSRINLKYGQIYDFPEIDSFVTFGRIGVDLFFLISGFVIALSAEGRTLAAYTSSRLTRIVPTYWLAIFMTVVVLLFEGAEYRVLTFRQLFANLFFIQQQMREPFIDGVYWTVVFELKFYFLVAILIAFNMYKYYSKLILAWVVICFADYLSVPLGPFGKILITSYGYYFAAGGAFYYLHQRRYILLSLSIIAISLLSAIPRSIERFGIDNYLPAVFLVLLCYVLMAIVSIRWFDNLRWSWLPLIGALTYPVYLLHEDIGYVLMRHINFTNNGFFVIIIIISIILLTSWLINNFFEKVFVRRLRRYLENKFSLVNINLLK